MSTTSLLSQYGMGGGIGSNGAVVFSTPRTDGTKERSRDPRERACRGVTVLPQLEHLGMAIIVPIIDQLGR